MVGVGNRKRIKEHFACRGSIHEELDRQLGEEEGEEEAPTPKAWPQDIH